MSIAVLSWILYYSMLYRVDPVLVEAVIQVESSGDNSKVGSVGELGYMQLRPQYFGAGLKDPKHNIEVGVKYLASLQTTCPHRVENTFVVCYNVGTSGAKKIHYPKNNVYYKSVMVQYKLLMEKK